MNQNNKEGINNYNMTEQTPDNKPGDEKSKNNEIPASIEQFVKKIIEKQLVEEEQEARNGSFLTRGDIKHLDSHIAEYLKCFIVLGYDLDGERLVLSHAPSQQDRDALIEHLKKTFLIAMNNN